MVNEEKYYTLKETMDVLNISKPTVYTWEAKGLIKSKEVHNGRLFIIPENLIEERKYIKKVNTSKSEEVIQEKQVKNETSLLVNSSNEIVLNLLNQLNDKTAKIIEYAEEAGKVKLLTDDLLVSKDVLKQLREDNKFYQEEYFRLKYELESLQTRYNLLTEDNKKLAKESMQIKEAQKIIKLEEKKPEIKPTKKAGFLGLFKK